MLTSFICTKENLYWSHLSRCQINFLRMYLQSPINFRFQGDLHTQTIETAFKYPQQKLNKVKQKNLSGKKLLLC